MSSNRTRRDFVSGAIAVGVAGGFAGCTGDGDDGNDNSNGNGANDDPDPDVVVGPGDEFAFDPEEITVSVGESVLWEFASPGHNVSTRSDHSEKAQLPDGAEAFSTYDGANKFETESEGATFEHTFETAGTYQYVCIPHAAQGMVGRVVVEE